MLKTYTANKVGKNHDWDFSVDNDGKITAINVGAEVNYGSMGMTESLDIWSLLDTTQKERIQSIYDKVKEIFDNEFLL